METTTDYLRELYRQSAKQTQDNLGTKWAFVILALKMASAAFAIGLLVALGFLPKNDPIYKTVFVIFTSDIVGLVALWCIGPIISLWNIPKIAAIKNKEQKDRLEELDPNLVKIAIDEFDQILPPKDRVALNVQNRDSREFDGVIELLNLFVCQYDEHCREIEEQFPVEANNSHFAPLVIKGNDHKVIDLAEMESDNFVLLTERKMPFSIPFFAQNLEPIQPPPPPAPPAPPLPFPSVQPTPPRARNIRSILPKFIKLTFGLYIEIRGRFGKEKDFHGRYIVTIDFESNPKAPIGQNISARIGNIEYVPIESFELS